MKCHLCQTFLDLLPLYYEADTEYLRLHICDRCYKELPEWAHERWYLRFNCPMDARK